jgi:hypothetical protein
MGTVYTRFEGGVFKDCKDKGSFSSLLSLPSLRSFGSSRPREA